MRHGCRVKKLSRSPEKRERLFRNLATHLFTHERIRTTLPRAKELRRYAEPLITIARRQNPQYLLRLRRSLNGESVVEKVRTVLAERYAQRPGGYTRIWRLGPRRSDTAPMALIELVDNPFDMKMAFEKMARGAAAKLRIASPFPKHVPLNRPLLR